MPSIAKDQKEFYKSKIRSLIAIDHGISRRALQEQLDKGGLHLDRDYIGKLYDEIMVERTKRMDRKMLAAALSSFEDTMTEVVRLAWKIANQEWTDPKARVMALREIREAHNDVFQKKLGTLDLTIRNAPLPDDRKKLIRDTFEQWGLLRVPNTEDAATPAPSPQDPA
jgi:hypothetical protein